MKHIFRKSSRKPPENTLDALRSSSSGQNITDAEEPTMTNYRSFSENHNSNSRRSDRRSSRRSTPRVEASTPSTIMQLTPMHQVILEDQRNLGKNHYRGFSTSMYDMYKATEFERVDCCAMVCGGIFQSDRDRYLLQGIKPPSITRRFCLHLFFPISIFVLAVCGALSIPDQRLNQFFAAFTLFLLLSYIVVQFYKGRAKRIGIRKKLLWTKAQLQENREENLAMLLEQEPPNDNNREQQYYLGQTRRDFLCAHPCCVLGLYAEDRQSHEMNWRQTVEVEHQSSNNHGHDAREHSSNLSRCLWICACPPIWCGHQVQCCGICALAQEGREIESAVLPAAYRRIDYISMQPISHYYPAIYRKRHGASPLRSSTRNGREPRTEGLNDSDKKIIVLSDLSWQLIQFALVLTGLVFTWCLVGKHFWKKILHLAVPAWRIFDFADFVVFVAAWAQAIALTAILAWLCNRHCPAHLSLDAMVKFFAAGFFLSTSIAVFWEIVLGTFLKATINLGMAIFGVNVVVDEDSYTSTWIGFGIGCFGRSLAGKTSDGEDFIRSFGNDHPFFFTIYIALSSFILAAFVEESCKYFGYRMVEHPDFMSRREIEDAMTVVIQGGEEDEEEMEARRRIQQQDLDQTDFSKQRKSLQSVGAAITLAMVCVAMGFTLCENLVYCFIYSGSTIGMEVSVLIARSFFPIHPIAAALQSIHVVEREVEITRTAKIGQILFPAVFFHGLYDFCILWIDFLSSRNGNSSAFEVAGLVSFVLSACIMLCGVVYYSIAASRQRSRLQVVDVSIESGHSSLI